MINVTTKQAILDALIKSDWIDEDFTIDDLALPEYVNSELEARLYLAFHQSNYEHQETNNSCYQVDADFDSCHHLIETLFINLSNDELVASEYDRSEIVELAITMAGTLRNWWCEPDDPNQCSFIELPTRTVTGAAACNFALAAMAVGNEEK